MMRRRAQVIVLVLTSLCACSRTQDVYLGTDLPTPDPQRDSDDAAAAPDAAPTLSDDAGASEPAVADAAPPDASEPAPPSCEPSHADCDADRANGCEADLTNDEAHCGRCDVSCQAPDCQCLDGRLTVSCPANRADCDGSPDNGCEVDTATSLQHCGRCERACHTNGHDALAAVCSAGRCELTCEAEAFPEIDCDGDPDNGCETGIWTDDLNCGACGVRCACNMGSCS